MKFIKIMMFLVFSIVSFGNVKKLSTIKSMDILINETIYTNNREKQSLYDLKFIKPDKVRKEILSPSMNKGEIYIYRGNEKIVYLPIFDEITKEINTDDENDILESLNYIINLEKNNEKFSKNYYLKKPIEIVLKKGTRVRLKDLKEKNNYLLPYKFEIYDGDMKIATLDIKNYEINPKISEKEFILDD